MRIVKASAFARAGLLGNPSDGYYGKTISISVKNFHAEVIVYEWPEVEIVLSRQDRCHFDRVEDLVIIVSVFIHPAAKDYDAIYRYNYGATKLAAEKLTVQSNAYAAGTATRYSCVRYGNVVGSRGSVVPLFLKQRASGTVTITDERMTRFWLTLDQGVRFVIRCLEQMHGGEVFVPKIPSMTVMDLARAVAPENEIEIIGIRPGEKLHEVLISEDESRHTRDVEDMYVIMPAERIWARNPFGWDWEDKGTALEDGFRYASNNNPQWLTIEQIKGMIAPIEAAYELGKLE